MTNSIPEQIIADLEADAWLQKTLNKMFNDNKDRIDAHFGDNVSQYAACKGLISGRKLRPCFRHMYLLNNGDHPNSDLRDWAEEEGINYNPEVVIHHYENSIERCREFPQPFLSRFLTNTMKDDLSKSSTTNIFRLMELIDMISREKNSLNGSTLISFKPLFSETVEAWVAKRLP